MERIMNPDTATTDRNPGRPREPETDQRILDAAQRLMAQFGYVRMSMDAVAAEAGVTKPTVYRRYPNKIELALAAIVELCDKDTVLTTGQTRTDLIAQMRQFRQAMNRPHGMSLLGTVLAEESETPELLERFREYLVVPRRQAVQTILETAQSNGELRPKTNLELMTNLLIGCYYAHYLSGKPFVKRWEEQVVDAVLASILA
jgi:AcrR family transcriptional regulator